MRLVQVDKTFAQIICKCGSHQRNILAGTIDNPSSIIFTKIKRSSRLVINTKPGSSQRLVIHFQDMGPCINENTYLASLKHSKKAFLGETSSHRVYGRNIPTIA